MNSLRAAIERARDTLLSSPDTVCLERARLVTDAYRMYEGEPEPVLRAKALDHVLRNLALD